MTAQTNPAIQIEISSMFFEQLFVAFHIVPKHTNKISYSIINKHQ